MLLYVATQDFLPDVARRVRPIILLLRRCVKFVVDTAVGVIVRQLFSELDPPTGSGVL